MADLPFPLLPLPESPPAQRRGARLSVHGRPLGRPPKSGNKRSADLAKYIEAQYGSTPGQQLAEIAMVKPAEVRRARADAQALGLETKGMSDLQLAFLVKAKHLAKALSIDTASAYAAQVKTLGELMPYIHQRQAQAAESKAKAPATVFMIPEGAAQEAQQLVDFSQDADDEALEILEPFEGGGRPVGNGQSDD